MAAEVVASAGIAALVTTGADRAAGGQSHS